MIPGSASTGAARPPGAHRATMAGVSLKLARRFVVGGAVASFGMGPLAARALGHGTVPAEPPSPAALLFGWSFEPTVVLPLAFLVACWVALVRRVDAAHPATPVPWRRSVAFLAGIAAVAVALQSGIERYDTTLFSIHMVQHLLLTLVAAPLIALGAPVTLLLRAASPRARQRFMLPILHSRILRVLAFPVVAWLLFAGVMWATHFSPLFDLALENRLIHDLEHGLYLGTALLFWWPAVGLDPAPWRLAHPVRVLHVFLQMPQNTFLAVVIMNAAAPLYPHYATLARPWGPTPLADQQMAGGIMWLGGDLLFIAAIGAILAGWMRHEERETGRADRRVDAERGAIRARETRLAERLADERERR
jgi:putative membrane protein